MKLLSEPEIRTRLEALPAWTREGTAILRDYTFPSFSAAMQFVNRIAQLAEEADHHPDIDIRYDRVKLALSTHSAGGLTRRDFDLAGRIEQAAS